MKRTGLFRRSRKQDFVGRPLTKQHGIQALLSLGVIALNAWLFSAAPLHRFDQMALDQFFRWRPAIKTDSSLVFIEIAEDGFQEIGRWPWPRYYHAVLTHLLNEWGAKAVVFDILFSEVSDPSDDRAFAEALRGPTANYFPVVLGEGEKPAWIHALPEFERQAEGIGHINAFPDPDGVLRRIRPSLESAGERHPHLALRVAFNLLGRELPAPNEPSFPTDAEGNLLINWAGRWTETFQHYSYVDILRSFSAQRDGEEPLIRSEAVRGKVCLVGVTALGHTDTKAVPLEPVYPGLGVNANVINSVLTNQFIKPVSFQTNLTNLIWVGLVTGLLLMALRPVAAFAASLFLGLAWIGAAFGVFSRYSIWISVAHPLLSVLGVFVISVVYIQFVGEREQRHLTKLATQDGLTGLYVISHFRMIMSQTVEAARRQKGPLSVLMMDVDRFKRVNDTYGHAAGDKVLQSVAGILKSSGRETDRVGRYGGEEIIMLLLRTGLEDAFRVAERIRKLVEQSAVEWGAEKISVTLSIGVGALHPEELTSDPMVARADQALYRAKEMGRNRVCSESDLQNP